MVRTKHQALLQPWRFLWSALQAATVSSSLITSSECITGISKSCKSTTAFLRRSSRRLHVIPSHLLLFFFISETVFFVLVTQHKETNGKQLGSRQLQATQKLSYSQLHKAVLTLDILQSMMSESHSDVANLHRRPLHLRLPLLVKPLDLPVIFVISL